MDGWNKSGVVGTWLTVILGSIAVWETWPKSEAAQGGNVDMSAWAIPSALIAALVLSGALHVIAALVARRKKDAAVNPLVDTYCPDEWLHEVARQQAETLDQFIKIECSLSNDGVFRPSAFLEFSFRLYSASVYRLTVTGIDGTIRFASLELESSPTAIVENETKDLGIGQVRTFVVKQPLTSEEVTNVLNQTNTFNFDRFGLLVAAVPAIKGQPIRITPRCTCDNKILSKKYPALEIAVLNLKAGAIVDLRNHFNWNAMITMEVSLKNLRSEPIVVESFELELTLKEETYNSVAETGDIWEKKTIDKDGNLTTRDKVANNLADRLPLRLPKTDSGNVQFIISRVGAVIISNQFSYKLFAVDKFGQRHPFEGAGNKPL